MWSWIKELLFLWISNGYSTIHVNFGGIRDPSKQNLALQFCRNRNKDVSILAESHINLDQTHHIRIFWVLKVSLRLRLIQKRGFSPLRLLSLMTEFSVFMSFQGIAPGNNWLRDVSLKDCKVIWKIKMREIKTKYYLDTLIVLWIKWRGMIELKHFENVVSIMPCQNSSCIMDWRVYGEGRTQILLSSLTAIDLLAQDLG